MTPEEESINIFDQFLDYVNCWDDNGNCSYELAKLYAKECALIAVDEIIKELLECGEVWMKSRIKYWEEVKQEIEKL